MRSPRRLAPSRSPPSRQPQRPPTPARPREHPMPDVPTTERATATLVPAVPGPHPDAPPFVKEAGELKESHSDRLAPIAPPLLDIDAYVEEFGRSVVPAYRRGIAARERPAARAPPP